MKKHCFRSAFSGRDDWIRTSAALPETLVEKRARQSARFFFSLFQLSLGEKQSTGLFFALVTLRPFRDLDGRCLFSFTSNKKRRLNVCSVVFFGRDDWIRTSGLCVPNAALYQTEPHLVFLITPVYFIKSSCFCQ